MGGWVPKSSVRPPTPAAQPKGGWKLGKDPFLSRGACSLDPYVGTGGREHGRGGAGAYGKIGTAPWPSPAPCGKELPGPTHGGEGAEVFFIYVYIFFFFKL